MDINELIAIVKKKLQDQIKIESINIEDKSFLHKNHVGNQKGKFHLKINLNSIELKKMNKIEGGIRLPLTQLQEKNCASIETEMLKLKLL